MHVSAGGRRIYYSVEGDGPALVLIHGLLSSSFCWRHNVGPLSRHFRVYALDLPGSGLSGPGLVSMGEAARVVEGFLNAMSLPRAHFLGTSTGGLAALILAAERPEIAGKLVLAAPVNPFSRYGRRAIRLGATRIGLTIFQIAQLAGPALTGFLLRRRLYGRPVRIPAETVAGYARPLARAGLPAELRNFYAHWDIPPLPPRLSSPVLLLWGEKDRQVPLESGRQMAVALGAPLEVIPGCGHLAFEEDPETFNRIVLDFLRQ